MTVPSYFEYVPPSNAIAFAPSFVEQIKTGHKTSTYRFGLKYDHINIGDIVDVINSETYIVELSVKIISKNRVTFSELPLDHGGHGSYESVEHMRQSLGSLYSYIGRAIKDDDLFLMFEFLAHRTT